MTSQPNPVDDQSMRALTDELAHLVLNEVAPEELALYPETAEIRGSAGAVESQASRRGTRVRSSTRDDHSVVISVAATVMQWLGNNEVDAAVKEASPSELSYLRGLFGAEARK